MEIISLHVNTSKHFFGTNVSILLGFFLLYILHFSKLELINFKIRSEEKNIHKVKQKENILFAKQFLPLRIREREHFLEISKIQLCR